ncbi:MAG: hypothetical protein VKO39_11710 [Cyanobacteriota bacterium]|nr:hypothetical protein [Cyanobacteriota bacterium]
MNIAEKKPFRRLNQQLSAIETSLTRKENVLSFLIIRFVLMSGMVLAFAWTFLQLSP